METLKEIYRNEIDIKKMSFLKAFFIILMFTVIQSIISFVSTIVIFIIDDNVSFGKVMIIGMLIMVFVNIIMVVVAGEQFTKERSIKINNKVKITKKDFIYVFFIIIGYILIREAVLFDILSKFEGPVSDADIDYFINNASVMEANIFWVILYFQSIIQAPIFEELFFRGIILQGVLNKYENSPKKAIIYSAIVFSIVHLNIPQGINAFIGGLILGLIYYYTKSMKLSIFAHIVNNLITFIPVPSNIIIKIIYILLGLFFMKKGMKYIKINENNRLAII
jgi:membrane protease YdiL (CAAX protease family)